MKPVNQKAWLLILPVILCVAFSAIVPLMTVVNYSVQDIISPERRVFVGTEWFKAVMRDDDLQGALIRQMGVAYPELGRAEALIRAMSGSYSGVMGLPLHETRALLRAAGYPLG